MKKWICRVIVVTVLGMGVGVWASEGTTYRMATYTLGVYDRNTPQNSTVVPTTATLAFAGLTLRELLECKYDVYGNSCGSGSVKKPVGLSPNGFQAYTNASDAIEFLLAPIIWRDGSYVYGVVVKLTDGAGGVYAQAIAARHAKSNDYAYRFVNLNAADGTITYNGSSDTVATSYNAASLGICGLTASRFLPPDVAEEGAAVRVWANAAGEPVLTLDDIKDYDFSSRYAGTSTTDGYRGGETVGCNKAFTLSETDGSVEVMTVEFQFFNSPYLKCVVGRFTNGVDGVYGIARCQKYINVNTVSGGGIGYHFANADGTYPSGTVSTGFTVNGYGIYELTATPPADVTELVLDTSKTWTELVAGVDIGARDQLLRIRVTGEHPTLTFDTAFNRSSLTVVNESTAATATFVLATSSFTLDALELGSDLALTLPLAAAPAAATVAPGATLCWIAPATGGTLATVIDGAGGVALLSGTATFTGLNTYMGGTTVKSGATLKPGSAGKVDTTTTGFLLGPFGVSSAQNPVTVEDGGVYDYAGRGDVYHYFVIGGTNRLVNTGGNVGSGTAQTYGISLSEDAALVMTNGAFGIVTRSHAAAGTLGLNGHTLVKAGNQPFYIWTSGTTVSGGGTLEIAAGTLNVNKGALSSGNNTTLRIGANASLTLGHDLSFTRIENNGTINFAPSLATNLVKGTYGGTGGTVYKTGANYGTMPFYGNSRTTYYVQQGTLGVQSTARSSASAYAFNTAENPQANQRVVVSPGATFDMRGIRDANYSVVIAGTGVGGAGAFVNSVANIGDGSSQAVQLTLADDASAGGNYDFGLLAPSYKATRLELDDHTRTINVARNFWLVNATVTGTGKVLVTRGTLSVQRGNSGSDWSLEIGAEGTLSNASAIAVVNFKNAGMIAGTQMITVSGTVTATRASIPKLTLRDGARVAVASSDAPLTVTGQFVASGTVTLDVAGMARPDKLVPLLSVPAGTSLDNVDWRLVNNLPGTTLVRRDGVPHLGRLGFVISFR